MELLSGESGQSGLSGPSNQSGLSGQLPEWLEWLEWLECLEWPSGYGGSPLSLSTLASGMAVNSGQATQLRPDLSMPKRRISRASREDRLPASGCLAHFACAHQCPPVCLRLARLAARLCAPACIWDCGWLSSSRDPPIVRFGDFCPVQNPPPRGDRVPPP